jgi:mRNA-degrading endonuclease RelE of RelBE toxin-antitoxin system
MFNAGSYPICIAEMSDFTDDAGRIFTKDEYEQLVLFLAKYPEAGDVIPGTGGVRKVRWRARGQGKRGGARVIYYFRDLNVPVYLLAVYAKGEKLNLTAGEKKAMSIMVTQIVNASVHKRLKVVINS